MLRTVEGTLDPEGTIRFHEHVQLTHSQRVLVTLLEEKEATETDESADGAAQLRALLASPMWINRPWGAADELASLVEELRNEWDA